MAKFKISTDEGTFMVDAPDEQTALEAVSDMPAPQPSKMSVAQDIYETTPLGMPSRMGRMAADFLIENGPSIASGVWDSAKQAYSAPYRAYTGELPMTDESGRTSDEAIAEGFNMATIASPASAANVAKAAAKTAVTAGARVPSEGAQAALAARELGINLPRAVTSDSAAAQNIGKRLSQIPVVGNPLRDASRTAVKQMDDAAKGVQDDLGTGSRELAGANVRRDLEQFAAKGEPDNLKTLYGEVDRLVDPNARIPLSDTRRIAQNINARRSASKLEGSSAVDFVSKALQTNGMSYDEIKNLRTAVGELKKNKSELAKKPIFEN